MPLETTQLKSFTMAYLKHFHYEKEIPWDKVAEEMDVELDMDVPIGYNYPQRWLAKLNRTEWKYYPTIKGGGHLELQVVQERGVMTCRKVDIELLRGTIHEPVMPSPKANDFGIERFIHRLGEIIVSAGGLHLKCLNAQTYPDARNKPDDPGPALSVYPGPWLGYCCLERDPHMHYLKPDGTRVDRDPEGADRKDPIGWMVQEVSTRAVELVTEAGYPDKAAELNQEAIAQGMKEVEQAFRMPQPRYPGQWGLPINWE